MSSIVPTQVNELWSWIKQNPITATSIGIGAASAILGAGALVRATGGKTSGKKKRKSTRKQWTGRWTRGRKSGRRTGRRIKHRTSPRGMLKRHKTKHRGGKAIHFTKHGQPYKIMSNGRARFIKKSSRRRK